MKISNLILAFLLATIFPPFFPPFGGIELAAQNIGINSTGAAGNSRAMLDIAQPGRGLLIPRMVKADRDTITSIPTSLLIYQTDNTPGYYYYNGSAWVQLLSSSSSGWALTGNAGTTVGTNFLGTTDAQDFALYTSNAERIRVASGGNVGIGTTSPTAPLHVSATNDVAKFQSIGTNAEMLRLSNTAAGGQDWIFEIGTTANPPAGDFKIRKGGSNGEFWIDDATGNVGIGDFGVSSPSKKLHVVGGDFLVNKHSLGNSESGIRIVSDIANTQYNWLIGAQNIVDAALEFIPSTTVGGTTFSTPAMVIKQDGNVGIGCLSPTQKLYVNGNIYATGSVLGSQAACSDVRWKKEFVPLDNSLNKIMQLNGFYYHFKTDEFPDKHFSKDQQIGMKAQEMEKLFPELIFTDAEGYKYLDYSRLTPILVEAIKELKAANDALKLENNNLKTEVGNLKSDFGNRLKILEEILGMPADLSDRSETKAGVSTKAGKAEK